MWAMSRETHKRHGKRSGRTAGSEPAMDKFLEMFRRWGRQGGKKRAERLSAEERSAMARKAVSARWKRVKKRKNK